MANSHSSSSKRQNSPRLASDDGNSCAEVAGTDRVPTPAHVEPVVTLQVDNPLQIQTTRFGAIDVDASRLLHFPQGLLGFPEAMQYALIQTNDENCFFWLQCTTDPGLAFVLTDPTLFFRDYTVPLRQELVEELALTDSADMRVFVICNKADGWLVGNLLGPLVINAANHRGQQVVLTERRWTTRQPLLKLSSQPLAKSA